MSKNLIFIVSLTVSIFVLNLGVSFIFPGDISALTNSTNYTIYADVLGGGGFETSTSSLSEYNLQDTLGEAIVNSPTTTSNLYGIKSGFRELYADQFITLSAGATSVELGTLTDTTPATGSHTLTVDTNASNGFNITLSGSTLTSGTDTITAIGTTATASSAGTEQYG